MSHPTDRSLALAGLMIAIAAIIVSVTVPEVRRYLGLEGTGNPEAATRVGPSAGATGDSTVVAEADSTGWRTTYGGPATDVAAPAVASFAGTDATDTTEEVVNAPTIDTVVSIVTTTVDTVYGPPR